MSDSTELATIRAKLKERERTSEYFNQIWEDEALPRLKETMVKGNITDYNISIQADYGEYGVLRIVEVVTRKRLPDNTNQELRTNVSKIFTPERSLHVTISFTIGVVKRTSGTEEPYASPGNARYHSPLMVSTKSKKHQSVILCIQQESTVPREQFRYALPKLAHTLDIGCIGLNEPRDLSRSLLRRCHQMNEE
ncbi:hypothetical protein CGCA056_v010467 [Colletotrichum aenigma]|uniref:uncharacterized protein n=1 Tax=Colletotrichum aenigma TaxID=1215731 RepID=UPI00187263B1|nr:uncharacterized protein CGCA056_v010467 [Colletotrichum aenigma]KAF5517386.1 hypothetical protein CGCA056_v010467 [Colletotrichum aenigma]